MIRGFSWLAILLFIVPGQAANPADTFLAAFRVGNYQMAFAVCDQLPADDPLTPSYRATCLAMLGRSEEAVEAFRRAAFKAGNAWDQVMIYARAQALFDARLYSRAQMELAVLERRFPHSRLAERGKDMTQRIERRLATGLSAANLEWYLDRGLAAYEAARPALAVEFLDEHQQLARRVGAEVTARQRLTLGAAYLELEETKNALIHLSAVPSETESYRGALFRGLVLSAHGDAVAAQEFLIEARDHTSDEGVKQRAGAILAELEAARTIK